MVEDEDSREWEKVSEPGNLREARGRSKQAPRGGLGFEQAWVLPHTSVDGDWREANENGGECG